MFLAELEKLALLVGKLPEQWMVCAFVSGLSSHVKRTLRMDDMTLGQLLTRARAIMIDEKEFEEIIAATTQPAGTPDNPDPPINHYGNITCYRCQGLNHFTKDCQYQHKEM